MESETVHQSANIIDVDDTELEVVEPNPNIAVDNPKPPKRPRTYTSPVWKHYTKIGLKDGVEKAKCNGCGKEYKISGNKIGTSTLGRHLEKCSYVPKFQDVGGMLIDHAGKLRPKELDHKRIREIISMAIIEHNMPFNWVEYKWIRELLLTLNSNVKLLSRNTAVADVWKFHLDLKDKLKQSLHRCRGRICLTSDCWTAYTQEGYICLTAHFVDNNWLLNSKILAFCKMEPPHTGLDLARKVFDCLKDWGIDRKIFSITLDNASANDNMQDLLSQQLGLQNSLLCEGEFFHVRCSAHILNLIVQEGLKVASGALKKIRDSIRYVRLSEARKILFKECVEQVRGIDTKVGLRMDVPTRWNSTFVMLESAIKYRRAFSSMSLRDSNYKACPSNEEWKRGEKMCEFLRPFYLITNLISGTSYPTSNLYFMQVWKIECLLRENANSDDEVIRDMAARMMTKFSKYWNDYSVILAIGAILDPRMKFDALRFCYSKLDSSTCEAKLAFIKGKLYKLFEDYVKGSSNDESSTPSSSQMTSSIQASSDGPTMDAFDEYINYVTQNVSVTGRSELDLYLDEAQLEPKYFEKLEVLKYWQDRQQRYPNLSKMACDVLSIPITTVASESAFSVGARVLTKYRCCLLPENVQALILTRNWLNGFSFMDGDEDGQEEKVEEIEIDSGNHGSNVVPELSHA